MIRDSVLAFGLVSTIATTVWAQELPCVYPRMDRVDAHLRAKATPSPKRFNYDYLLENRHGASQVLNSFAIQAFVTPGIRVTQARPADWRTGGPITDTAFYTWAMLGGPRGLAAGTSAIGFGFADADIPAIVMFLAWGKVQPPTFPAGEAPEDCENTDIIQNSFKGKTVGPKPPPDPFVPIDFLNYLITLVHDSRQQGWIKVDGVHQSLLAKLTNAKRKLEAGDTKVAKDILNAFLNEVQATACPDFTCPENKPLTSEAYALLFFNGRFLWERLP